VSVFLFVIIIRCLLPMYWVEGELLKRKIENAADVDIELVTTEEGDSNVELRGPGNNRELGRDYICFLLLHKKGESLDINLEDRDDCTWIDVPQDTIGYVTGRERSTMNSMEEETDTLMFFLDKGKRTDDGDGDAKPTEKLLMSAIETKSPGFFLDDKERWNLGDKHDPKLGLTTVKMTEGQFTYALGRRGTTRRKLEKASGAIMEVTCVTDVVLGIVISLLYNNVLVKFHSRQYIGYTAFICGTKEERRRGRDYLNYLLDQREGEVHVDTDRRDDITIIDCPEEYVGYITGHRGSELRSVEDRTGTFCFMDGADVSGDVGGGGKWYGDGWSLTTVHSQRGGQPEGEVEEDGRHRGIRVPSNFDNKHSNEEVEARREEKWGPRPPQQPEKDNNDKDDVEGAGGERDASPRSVSPEGGSRERSHHSKSRSRSHSASADRKRSRSKDDDDTEEREEEDSHRKDPSPARDDKHSSREVDERSNSRSSAKRRRSLSPSEKHHHHGSPSEERDDR
ncbi:hypothetical protein FOZ60_012990, partial [Perkinsus olseni]